MSHRRETIESVDGGRVHFDAEEEDEADACNADTFGDDALEVSGGGFFENPSLKEEKPMAPPPGLVRSPQIMKRELPVRPAAPIWKESVPPPPPPPPPTMNVATRFGVPSMSIHVVPVRVFPTPFTSLQHSQALSGRLDVHKWGKQAEFVRSDLMTRRDKEFVTKIQLNQMVALNGSSVQNFRGQFTFGSKKSSSPSEEDGGSSNLGKRLYSSVYHPRKLLNVNEASSNPISEFSEENACRHSAEKCFDLLLDLNDVDEYIGTLHPLAEEKINEAIIERTEIIEKMVQILKNVVNYATSKKLNTAKERTINAIVQLVQPEATVSSEAEARRSLIFRRVPETVQGFYIDMLEELVASQ